MPHKTTKAYAPLPTRKRENYLRLKSVANNIERSLNGEVQALDFRGGQFFLSGENKEHLTFLLDCWKVKLKPDVVLKYRDNSVFRGRLVITIEML